MHCSIIFLVLVVAWLLVNLYIVPAWTQFANFIIKNVGNVMQGNFQSLQSKNKCTSEWLTLPGHLKLSYQTTDVHYLKLYSKSATKTILFCHGSGLGLEYYYYDLLDVHKQLNINIIAVEYNEFYSRRVATKYYQNLDTFLQNYTLDCLAVLQYEMHVDHSSKHLSKRPLQQPLIQSLKQSIQIVGSCFGAFLAIELAYRLPCEHLYLFKPMISTRQLLYDNLGSRFITSVLPQQIFELDTVKLQQLQTKKIVIVQGLCDRICKSKNIGPLLLNKLPTDMNIEVFFIPKAGHNLTIKQCFEAML